MALAHCEKQASGFSGHFLHRSWGGSKVVTVFGNSTRRAHHQAGPVVLQASSSASGRPDHRAMAGEAGFDAGSTSIVWFRRDLRTRLNSVYIRVATRATAMLQSMDAAQASNCFLDVHLHLVCTCPTRLVHYARRHPCFASMHCTVPPKPSHTTKVNPCRWGRLMDREANLHGCKCGVLYFASIDIVIPPCLIPLQM